jgi:hypothetical protein
MRRNKSDTSDLSKISRIERENKLEYYGFNSDKITITSNLSYENCKNIISKSQEDLCRLIKMYEDIIEEEKISINQKDTNKTITSNIIKEQILILINIVRFKYIKDLLNNIKQDIDNHKNKNAINSFITYYFDDKINKNIVELYSNKLLEYNFVITHLINIFKRKSDYLKKNSDDKIKEAKFIKYEDYKNKLETHFNTLEKFNEYIYSNSDTTECFENIDNIIYYLNNELFQQYKELKIYYNENPQIDINSQDKIINYYFNKYDLISKIDIITEDFDVLEQNSPKTQYYKKYLKYKQKYLKLKQQINQ